MSMPRSTPGCGQYLAAHTKAELSAVGSAETSCTGEDLIHRVSFQEQIHGAIVRG